MIKDDIKFFLPHAYKLFLISIMYCTICTHNYTNMNYISNFNHVLGILICMHNYTDNELDLESIHIWIVFDVRDICVFQALEGILYASSISSWLEEVFSILTFIVLEKMIHIQHSYIHNTGDNEGKDLVRTCT